MPGSPIETYSESVIRIYPSRSAGSARSSSVATDQKTSTIDAESEAAGPAIENEIPTYRAISARAIFSVACGLLSVCSFAHPLFYAFSILAIGFGIWAHRAIRRFPDILTGRGLANAGIGLGLAFGLASGTITTVQYVVRSRQAARYAVKYAEILKSPDLGLVLWYNTHPEMRKDKTGAELVQDVESKSKERRMMESKMGPLGQLSAIRSRLAASKDEDIHFVKIERVGEDEGHGLEMQIFALALFEVVGPGNKEFPEKQQFALAVLKARPKGREYEWWTDSIVFPYKPQSYTPTEKAVGDGHNHAEGGH
jgi:Domain of unknown function (DUF4190)